MSASNSHHNAQPNNQESHREKRRQRTTQLDNALITAQTALLDKNIGQTKAEILHTLTTVAVSADRVSDSDAVVTAALKREAQSSTGLPGGVAIPHCRSAGWQTPTIVFARLDYVSEFETPDGPADLVFFIGVPDSEADTHTDILKQLAKGILKKTFLASLRGAESSEEAAEIINEQLHSAPRERTRDRKERTGNPHLAREEAVPVPELQTHILAITACPTGIAHTYIAADALRNTAESMENVNLSIETQGARGTQSFNTDDLSTADVVLVAADIPVQGLDRFGDTPIVSVAMSRAINQPHAVLADAIDAAKLKSRTQQSNSNQHTPTAHQLSDRPTDQHWLARITRQCYLGLQSGLSYLIPFAVAAGLLATLSYLLSRNSLVDFVPLQTPISDLNPAFGNLAAKMYAASAIAYDALIPILAGFTAFGIAGRAALAPGFIGGALAVALNMGFIGGIVVGLLAGAIVELILVFRGPPWWQALTSVVVVPLLATVLVALLSFGILATPLNQVNKAFIDWMSSADTISLLIIAIVFGALMCIDLGGPVNKIVYLLTVASLAFPTSGSMRLMAAVMAAGMVPPLAAFIATALRPGLFTEQERSAGRSGWWKSALFISEGALPLLQRNRTQTMVSFAIGGSTAAALSTTFNAATAVPHGGVVLSFAVAHPLWWLVSIAIASVLSALLLLLGRISTQQKSY